MAQAKRFNAGTNSNKKASPIRMEFTEKQIDAIEKLIEKEISNKMLIDKIKSLKSDIEHLVEKDGWNLQRRLEKLIESNDAFILPEPEPELDANHVDDPEQYI